MSENPYQSPPIVQDGVGCPLRWTPYALGAYAVAFAANLGSVALCLAEPPVDLAFDPLVALNVCQVALLVAWVASEICLFLDERFAPEAAASD